MAEVRWDGGVAYEMVLEGDCEAPPDDVYDVLADLSTHIEWAGRRQFPGFRLISVDATGSAEVGTEFATVGSIPMTRRRWENQNTVVLAQRPMVLEFHTEARITRRPGRSTEATYEHRYEVAAEGSGSHVVYRMRQTDMRNAMRRMRLPLMRTLTHRVMIPFLCRRGFKNLLRLAEQSRSTGVPARAR